METRNKTVITVETTINAPVEKAWEYWTKPEHITQWANASDDWHTTRAENDVRVGGSFLSRMEAKDGSFGFDFGGVYDVVTTNENIEYTIGDGRKVKITFSTNGDTTKVIENFEAEETNPIEMQRGGWQAILDNFKKIQKPINDFFIFKKENDYYCTLMLASIALVLEKRFSKIILH